jgi:hypothetical protein
MLASKSATAHTPHPFDQTAFQELADSADKAKTAFELNAIDRGFDRLIDRPHRAKSGATLAARLTRDARKHFSVNRRHEVLSDGIEAQDPRSVPPTNLELFEIRSAVGTILKALKMLSARERMAISMKSGGLLAPGLAVKPRQLRNIMAAIRTRLWHQPDVEDAYRVVLGGLERWRWETISQLWPLRDFVAGRM